MAETINCLRATYGCAMPDYKSLRTPENYKTHIAADCLRIASSAQEDVRQIR